MAWENHPVSTRPTTPEEVLTILAEDYRQEANNDILHDLPELTFATTVDRWMDFDEFPDWRRWGEWLNGRFGIDVALRAWNGVLTPMKKRTLREVCELIAGRARVPVVEPASVLGRSCHAAGAFLTLRELLRRRNVNVGELRPSTTIEDFPRTDWLPLMLELVRLRPCGLPLLKLTWRNHWSRTLTIAMLLGGMAVGMLGGILLGMKWTPAPMVMLLGGASALSGYLAQRFTPDPKITRVEFGKLRTFRDVCESLAADEGQSGRLALSSG